MCVRLTFLSLVHCGVWFFGIAIHASVCRRKFYHSCDLKSQAPVRRIRRSFSPSSETSCLKMPLLLRLSGRHMMYNRCIGSCLWTPFALHLGPETLQVWAAVRRAARPSSNCLPILFVPCLSCAVNSVPYTSLHHPISLPCSPLPLELEVLDIDVRTFFPRLPVAARLLDLTQGVHLLLCTGDTRSPDPLARNPSSITPSLFLRVIDAPTPTSCRSSWVSCAPFAPDVLRAICSTDRTNQPEEPESTNFGVQSFH